MNFVESGEIKSWKATEILAELQAGAAATATMGRAAGKVILLGEHAAVYGRHALALPLPDAVGARVESVKGVSRLAIPVWGISQPMGPPPTTISESGGPWISKRFSLVRKSISANPSIGGISGRLPVHTSV